MPRLALTLAASVVVTLAAAVRAQTIQPSLPQKAALHFAGEEMVDVGGHKLQLLRGGQGIPTVVFESGSGHSLATWSKILPAIDEFTSTVCYSRAGLGASEPASDSRTPTVIADELHTMLTRADVRPPYVLVGHSAGGLYVRVFAIKYPSEVVGLVLVDGTHERQVLEINGNDPEKLARLPKLPESARGAADLEFKGLLPTFMSGKLGLSGKLPDVPMVVLTSLQSDGADINEVKIKRDLQSEIFQSTTYGMHIVTSKSDHFIQKNEPGLVINAIRWVVDAARVPK